MIFREITFGSADFRKERELRDRVLRKPLGLVLEVSDEEKDQWHFGLFDLQDDLLGTVIAVPLGGGEAKVRQMAVAPNFARRGFGRRVLQELEDRLREKGIYRISLHARTTAAGFYRKAGYVEAGPEFVEVGIPHVKMEKTLPAVG